MDWLVTFRSSVAPEEMRRVLEQSGCAADEVPPVPLDGGEHVVSAQGPPDLPQRLALQEGVVKVSPNSSLTLY